METKQYKSIDEYIRSFPKETQRKLTELRRIIRKEAPGAEEKISYQIPTFFLNGNLVHFAGFAKHIGFYPTPGALRAFKNKLSKYKSAKGSIQFPIDEPLPTGLIKQMVKFRVAENAKKGK